MRAARDTCSGFGAVSGTVGPESECGGLPARRLRRAAPADASGGFRKEGQTLRRHDRHNDVKTTRVHADGDLQGRAFFDHTVLADRYATLVGRSEPSFERFLATVREEEEQELEAIKTSSPVPTSEVPMPMLLGSVSRGRGAQVALKDGDKELEATVPDSPRWALQGGTEEASLSQLAREVAQDSANFGALLQAAHEALEEERHLGSVAEAHAQERARQLHKQLDEIEARTRELTAAARAAAGVVSPSKRRAAIAAEVAAAEALTKQQKALRRKSFNLVGRGPGWYVEPAQSQL